MIFPLATSLILSQLWLPIAPVAAGNVTFGGACNITHNRLSPDTKQFTGDCTATTYCSGNGTCLHKGCRRDEYPFGCVLHSLVRWWLGGSCSWQLGRKGEFNSLSLDCRYRLFSHEIPPRCEPGNFCPDEEDACQPVMPVGSICQLNRDGQWLASACSFGLTPDCSFS